ncbi:hypothetical protein [Reyranella aquatilis]|uniref:hypothetical protein n=1 Tax=Reyranella aquatilis TaxID=2035356 RepID=UPI002E75EF40|nr:hypothetical protein [Reyranella aquatilis]
MLGKIRNKGRSLTGAAFVVLAQATLVLGIWAFADLARQGLRLGDRQNAGQVAVHVDRQLAVRRRQHDFADQ